MGSTHLHGSEFVEFEVLFVLSDAFLGKQHRAWIIKHNPENQDEENRTEQYHGKERKDYVRKTLDVLLIETRFVLC